MELWPWGNGFALDGFAGGGVGWLKGQSCCCPAGPRGSLVPVPTLVAPAPALLAARPVGCLAWARLCIPKNRARDDNSLLFLQERVSPGPHLARAQWLRWGQLLCQEEKEPCPLFLLGATWAGCWPRL